MGIFNMTSLGNDEQVEEKKQIEANKVNDNTVVIKDSEDKKIKLEGSLSEVYTKALNEACALENMGSIINLKMKMLKDQEADGFKESDLYIHIPDQKEIEEGDISQVAGKLKVALDNQTSKRKIVVFENYNGDNRTKLLKDYLVKLGIECITNRTMVLEAIRNTIKV